MTHQYYSDIPVYHYAVCLRALLLHVQIWHNHVTTHCSNIAVYLCAVCLRALVLHVKIWHNHVTPHCSHIAVYLCAVWCAYEHCIACIDITQSCDSPLFWPNSMQCAWEHSLVLYVKYDIVMWHTIVPPDMKTLFLVCLYLYGEVN